MRKILFALLLVISGVMLVSPTIADAKTAQDYPKPEVGFLDNPYIRDTSKLKYGKVFEDWDGVKWQDVTGTVLYDNNEAFNAWAESDESDSMDYMTHYENKEVYFSARLNVETGVFYDRIPADEEKNYTAGYRVSLKNKDYDSLAGCRYEQYKMMYPKYFLLDDYELPYNNFTIAPEITYSKKGIADVKVVDDIFFGRNSLLIKPLKVGKTYVTLRFQSEGCCDAIYRFYVDVKKGKEYYSDCSVGVCSEEDLYELDRISNKKTKRCRSGIIAIMYNSEENKNYQPDDKFYGTVGTYVSSTKLDVRYFNFLNFPQYVIKNGKVVKNERYLKMVEIFGLFNDAGILEEKFKRTSEYIEILSEYDDMDTTKRTQKDMYTMLIGKYSLMCLEQSYLTTVVLHLCGIQEVSFYSREETHIESKAIVRGLIGDGICPIGDFSFEDKLIYKTDKGLNSF